MTRRRRIAVLAAATGLALSACANQDADINDVRDALREANGLTNAQVRACTRAFEDANFSQDQLNEIADADTLADLPNDLAREVERILQGCISGTTTTRSGEPSEGTTTTAP